MDEDQVTPALEENEEELELDLSEDEEAPEETAEELRARVAKAEEVANNQRIRAEKAEGKLKESKPAAKPQAKEADLSQTDLYALIKADVPEDAIGEIKDVAKLKGISVAEALKTTLVKSILAERAEQKATAEATNTGTARRTGTTLTPAAVLEKARKGELPDTDAGLEALLRARKGL